MSYQHVHNAQKYDHQRYWLSLTLADESNDPKYSLQANLYARYHETRHQFYICHGTEYKYLSYHIPCLRSLILTSDFKKRSAVARLRQLSNQSQRNRQFVKLKVWSQKDHGLVDTRLTRYFYNLYRSFAQRILGFCFLRGTVI